MVTVKQQKNWSGKLELECLQQLAVVLEALWELLVFGVDLL
jgi:hypothetical protein